jgi:hypothetical protein
LHLHQNGQPSSPSRDAPSPFQLAEKGAVSDHIKTNSFEDRGPACTLLVFIDDATSSLMHLRFVKSESTLSYFGALEGYLMDHGRPVALFLTIFAIVLLDNPPISLNATSTCERVSERIKPLLRR